MAIVHALDIEQQALAVVLGQLNLTADRYDLQVKRPVIRQNLLDGSCHETLLSTLPCTLTLYGRFLPSDFPLLQQTLRTAISNHDLFDFELDGFSFSDMAVSEYRVSRPEKERFCTFSVTFCGEHSGEVTNV